MLSMDFDLSVTGYSISLIGYHTMVRSHLATLVLKVTNDGPTGLRDLTVRPVLESYVGQEEPHLFTQLEAIAIKDIPGKGMVPLQVTMMPAFPGLVSVAFYAKDAAGNVVRAKRMAESAYQELPVRWWFHVLDNISLDTLLAIKTLASRFPKVATK